MGSNKNLISSWVLDKIFIAAAQTQGHAEPLTARSDRAKAVCRRAWAATASEVPLLLATGGCTYVYMDVASSSILTQLASFVCAYIVAWRSFPASAAKRPRVQGAQAQLLPLLHGPLERVVELVPDEYTILVPCGHTRAPRVPMPGTRPSCYRRSKRREKETTRFSPTYTRSFP